MNDDIGICTLKHTEHKYVLIDRQTCTYRPKHPSVNIKYVTFSTKY